MWIIAIPISLCVIYYFVKPNNDFLNMAKQIFEYSKRFKKLDDRGATQTAENILNQIILPKMKEYLHEATEYYERRNRDNVKLQKIAAMVKKHIPYKLVLMSSFGAGLNLIGQSDIDFGLLVDDLTAEKSLEYEQVLKQYGFKFSQNVGDGDVQYWVCARVIDEVVVEIKIRDSKKSSEIVRLHRVLDMQLSEQERILITWFKLKMKEISQEAYYASKLIIYNAYMNKIQGKKLPV